MKRTLPILLVLILCSCSSSPSATAEGPLVFEGTVASIEISPLPQSRQNFIVTMRVDRVVRGQFGGKTFQFRVHSPSLSGLEVGKKYTVEAKRTKDGYAVDQHQWNRAKMASVKPRPIVVATFTEGREVVILPDPQKLKSLGLTAEQLEPLRRKRLSSGDWHVEIGGRKINLADVATVKERDLQVAPFSVMLPDGREVVVAPDAKSVGRYLITGEAFEEDVRSHLAHATVTDVIKLHVLQGIPVPGGKVPNVWGRDHVHISVGEPLETFAKVEVRAKPGW
jgi:hypothetical protein